MTKQPAVYILASKHNGTLYVGVTSALVKRVWEHKNDLVAGFTRLTASIYSCTLNCMTTWYRR